MSLLVKFGALLIKQVSKPIAAQLKAHLQQHPTAKHAATLCSQQLHRANVRINQALKPEHERFHHQTFAGRLTDDRATELFSSTISEFVVYLLTGTAIVRSPITRHHTSSPLVTLLAFTVALNSA
jgi:hypothetical protein